ncbi:MAG: helicase-related protein, partial [Trueperaceae bacterium]
DVAMVSHVVNYDVPDTEEAYVHRIGRTGRARAEGDAVTFVSGEDESMVRRIEKVLGERIERIQIEDFEYRKAAPTRLDADDRRFERGGVAGGGQAGRGGAGRGGRPAPARGRGDAGGGRPAAPQGSRPAAGQGGRPAPARDGAGGAGGSRPRRRGRGGSAERR